MPAPARSLILLAALACSVPLLLPATAAGELSPSSSEIDFGPVSIGSIANEAVILANYEVEMPTTVQMTNLEAEEPPGQFEVEGAGCEGAVLDEGQTCAIYVTFLPTVTGEAKATLVIENDANPVDVTLQGEGTPEFSIAQSPFDFGSVAPGSRSAAQVFTVTNLGSSAAAIGTAALSGTDAGQFQITADACGETALAQGERCDVGVVFAPTSAGAKSATLELPSDAPESPATAAISGAGADPPTPPAGGGAPAAGPGPAKPSSAFSFGKVIFNRHRGTASLPVRVPGPGVLVLGGKGILARKGPGAAVVLGGAGVARVAIVPTGRREAALNRSGRAKVLARVTYIPNGGDPLTKTRKIGLRKRR